MKARKVGGGKRGRSEVEEERKERIPWRQLIRLILSHHIPIRKDLHHKKERRNRKWEWMK